MTNIRRRAASAVLTGALALAAVSFSSAEPTPRGAHVAFGADPTTQATVTWFTDGSADPGTVIEYGPAADALSTHATGTSSRAPGSGYPSGAVLVHEVALSGLTPGADVFYRVGAPGAFSPIRSFRTAPADGDAFRFVAYADQDVTAAASATNAAVLQADPDLVVIAGDLSYAQGGTPTFPEWPKWDTWFNLIEPLAATRAVMPAVGNHECESVGCTSSFRSRFALPGQELFYGFDYLNAHFAVFLSDRGTWQQERRIADALAFLRADLEAAAQRKAAGEIDWIFVVQHHPLYGNQPGGELVVDEYTERKRNPALITLEEPLLHAYDVDVLITGHNHHYTRSYPMAFGVPTASGNTYVSPDGFVEVITGGAGRGLYGVAPPGPTTGWMAAQASRHHFSEFVIDGGSLTFRAIATDGGQPSLLDTFTITKD